VAEKFPSQTEKMNRLADMISNFDEVDLEPPELSAREEVVKYIDDPLLIEMLFAPIMYYGNPCENDMDFAQFTIMCKSIYQMGFCRPADGMKPFIEYLVGRFREAGGELRLGTRVTELAAEGDHITGVRLANGETLPATMVLSSAGLVETTRLCSDTSAAALEDQIGALSFLELIAFLDQPAHELGIKDTITFFNNHDRFTYRRPEGLYDTSSGVICCPGNFAYDKPPEPATIRITAKASYPAWRELAGTDDPRSGSAEDRHTYAAAKEEASAALIAEAERQVGPFAEHVTFTDLFTPLTITRFTGHYRGAVYGAPEKHRKGTTPYDNLYLCGTDQGFLGIVGSMLSGISMANMYGLQ
jgi:phytoene dehydrogenase-like protein